MTIIRLCNKPLTNIDRNLKMRNGSRVWLSLLIFKERRINDLKVNDFLVLFSSSS
jgi:hypothetical protein